MFAIIVKSKYSSLAKHVNRLAKGVEWNAEVRT
jgi:hypothetical protein